MRALRTGILAAVAFSSFLALACDRATPTENKKISLNPSITGTTSLFHGTTMLNPSSNTTVYLYPSQVSSYVINAQAEFWYDEEWSGDGNVFWTRDIK